MIKYFAQLIPADENPFPNVDATDSVVRDTIIPTAFAVIALACVVFIILGGFRYVASAGNPEQAKQAKDTILYAVVGLVVAFFAATAVSFVLGAVGSP